jgi:putative FmdB family regulatory protein
MPLYEYECGVCGVFTVLRKVSECSAPVTCEECGGVGVRIISAPNLSILNKAQRSAHERNENSAHAPGVRRRSSCGCTGTHTCKSTGTDTSQAEKKSTGFQMQTKKTARPWMLGH